MYSVLELSPVCLGLVYLFTAVMMSKMTRHSRVSRFHVFLSIAYMFFHMGSRSQFAGIASYLNVYRANYKMITNCMH